MEGAHPAILKKLAETNLIKSAGYGLDEYSETAREKIRKACNAPEAFWPFGKEIVYGNGMFSFLVNLIWIVFFGWEMALGNLIVGCIWCITIVGIPFGKQFFKMARLSFMPFGASVIG